MDHDLTSYPSFNLAFVVTGRTTGQNVTLKVYKNSSTDNDNLIETIEFRDGNTSTTTSSYGEALSHEVDIDWTDVTQIVVKVEQHPTNCHLNSIWTAMPEHDFTIMNKTEVDKLTTGNQSKVALAFVGSAQHVMDYCNEQYTPRRYAFPERSGDIFVF